MRTETVDLDGPVHVADFGGSGSPILLVHGLEGSHVDWLGAGPSLTALGRPVAVDLVGFGRTPLDGRRADLRTNRDMLCRLVDEVFGEPAIVVGNSMGGLLAMLVAARCPDHVTRLVLVDPGQPKPPGVPVNRMLAAGFVALTTPGVGEAAMWLRQRFTDPEQIVEQTLQTLARNPSSIPDHVRDAYVDMARERAGMPWAGAAFLQASRSMVRLLARDGAFPAFLQRLEPPTLVVHGAADELVNPDASRWLVRQRPDWDLRLLDGLGHSPQVEAPERFTAVMSDWLDDATSAA